MSDMVYIPKLFGGPSHGKRMAFSNPRAPVQYTVSNPKTPRYFYPSDSPAPTTLEFQQSTYTRRDFQFGKKLVIAFVISSADSERAYEMVCNYLLRTALPC